MILSDRERWLILNALSIFARASTADAEAAARAASPRLREQFNKQAGEVDVLYDKVEVALEIVIEMEEE